MTWWQVLFLRWLARARGKQLFQRTSPRSLTSVTWWVDKKGFVIGVEHELQPASWYDWYFRCYRTDGPSIVGVTNECFYISQLCKVSAFFFDLIILRALLLGTEFGGWSIYRLRSDFTLTAKGSRKPDLTTSIKFCHYHSTHHGPLYLNPSDIATFCEPPKYGLDRPITTFGHCNTHCISLFCHCRCQTMGADMRGVSWPVRQ